MDLSSLENLIVFILLLPKANGAVVNSCDDLKQKYPDSTDGEYWIRLENNQVALLYCHDMEGTPKEYITLQEVNQTSSMKIMNDITTCDPTVFQKIRLDLMGMEIIRDDLTFTSNPMNGVEILRATGCSIANPACAYAGPGISSLDLQGTGFHTKTLLNISDANLIGFNPHSLGLTTNADGTVVTVTGDGGCGGGKVMTPLLLAYDWAEQQPPVFSNFLESCAEIKQVYPKSVDGEYWIRLPDNQVALLYCHDMEGTPREYITLVGETYSRLYADVASCPGSYFQKIRFNSTSMQVIRDDLSFTSNPVDALEVLKTEGCLDSDSCGGWPHPPESKLDLSETGFKTKNLLTLADTTSYGYQPGPITLQSNVNRNILTITGEGYCGGAFINDPLVLDYDWTLKNFTASQPKRKLITGGTKDVSRYRASCYSVGNSYYHIIDRWVNVTSGNLYIDVAVYEMEIDQIQNMISVRVNQPESGMCSDPVDCPYSMQNMTTTDLPSAFMLHFSCPCPSERCITDIHLKGTARICLVKY